MRIRIKEGIQLVKMITPYGTITHEWTTVPDGSYIYKELEVFGGPKAIVPENVVPETVAELEEEELEADFADELASVKGIGRNTVADIKRVFKSEEALIRALGKDKVPLRDDVVKALKKHYRIR